VFVITSNIGFAGIAGTAPLGISQNAQWGKPLLAESTISQPTIATNV